ncbi:MAG: glycosyltransferase family 2 protein [Candidatus Wallbacteria bacterium]|nr:glycosyltransferase family 2 protein [Candidatus Wallbacteria bacterium]
MEKPVLSVIIPAFNEEHSIEKTVSEVHAALSAHPHEILVVDDGSTDNTASIAETLNCRIVRHERNRGYGASLKSGIRHANAQIIAITDADQTYPNDRLPELLEYMRDFDMVVGARTGKKVYVSLLRRPAKWFLKLLADYLTGVSIPDLNSGLRLFKKELAERFWGILPSGFSFTTTITLAALSSDFPVKFVPVDYFKREGHSKIRPIGDTLNFISLIVRTILYFNPLKVFFPLFLLVTLIGMGVFGYTTFVMDRVMDISVTVILFAAIQLLAIGLIADVVVKRGGLK